MQSYNLGKSLAMDEVLFREKLKTMGKTSKRKFAQLAGMFSQRRKQGGGSSSARQLLGQAPAPANDELLLNAEPLVCPEESDGEDEDERERDGRRRHQHGASSSGSSSSKTPTKGKYMSFS